MVEKFRNTMAEIAAAKSEIDSVISANDEDDQLMKQLISVKKILSRLEE